MAVNSLRYTATHEILEESRSGIAIYDGSADRFFEWSFQAQLDLKLALTSKLPKEEIPKYVKQVVDGLRGAALDEARDMDVEALTQNNKDGLEMLIDRIKKRAFPNDATEAKDLYAKGHQEGGSILSRQPGESMVSYVKRRRKW